MNLEKKCTRCNGSLCCTYITQQIPTPRSKDDYDHLLWQIAHQNVQVYKDEGKWHLLINNHCSYLLPSGQCGIYAKRPNVCRDYSNEFCEYDAPAESNFELFFRDYDALEDYCRTRFKKW